MQVLPLKHDVGNDSKYTKTDALLYNLQLHKIERSAIAHETKAVGWHLTAILEEGNAPRKRYHSEQRPFGGNARLL